MQSVRCLIIWMLLFANVLFSACAKRGCTDIDATNFDENAEKNIDNCMFEGRVVFWFDQSVTSILIDSGSYSLSYFINNERVGRGTSGEYGGGNIECGMPGLVTARYNLEKRKSREFDYTVVDQNDKIWWQGKVTIEANTCKKVQLE